MPPAEVIVELGAGTGKFTRLLAHTGARIIAVEPQAAMAAHISAMPNIEVMAGTAEAIPLPAASADLVCCATSFHWFDYQQATAEIVRVLQPEGHLALVWNVRDNRVPWVAEVTALLNEYGKAARRYGSMHWRVILTDPRFETLREIEHPFAYHMPVGGIVDRVLSTSFIAALPQPDQQTVRQRAFDIIARYPELKDAREIDFPYISRLYLLRRLA